MTNMDRIELLRRLIHTHSVLYYHFGTNAIPDYMFDAWCRELVFLQEKVPQYRGQGYMHEYFDSWDGSSAYDIPITEDAVLRAEQLMIRGYAPVPEGWEIMSGAQYIRTNTKEK